MSTSKWATLGAVGGFVGAAGTAVLTGPITVPTMGAIAAATGLTTVLGPVIGRGIEYMRGPQPGSEPENTPPSPVVQAPPPKPSRSSPLPSPGKTEAKPAETKVAEPDFFSGTLPDTLTITSRPGDLTASGEHHKDFEFNFSGTKQKESYNLDPWIVGNKAVTRPRGQAATVTRIATAWTCNNSIIDALVNEVILAQASADDDSGVVASAGLKDKAARTFVLHMMALRGNMAARIADVPANCPSSVMIVPKMKGSTVPSETIQINWVPILKAGRQKVRAAIMAGTRCPAKDSVMCAHDAVAESTQPGFVRLRALNLLEGSTFAANNGSQKVQTQKSLNFATGHLRFILYLEWRAADELITAN